MVVLLGKKVMTFLIIHTHYQQPGGEDSVFFAETALLRKYDYKVEEYQEDNSRILEMGRFEAARQSIWSRSSYYKMLQILSRSRPDVAHFHNTFLLISPSAYYACRKAGVPVVQTLHNYRLLCPGATLFRDGRVCEDCLGRGMPWPGIVHACYRESSSQTAVVTTMLTIHRLLGTWQKQVDVYIALTEFARKKFIAGGLPEDKIKVKPNFLLHDPGAREGTGDFALYVGRLSPEKGLDTLLRAWQDLKNIPLTIAGDGPLMREIQVFIEKHKLNNVRILGRCPREEVFALIKKARFLVFPSEWYEGFPMTIIEAFACGVPIIGSRLGSIEEIVQDGRTGLLFKPGNPDDLAEKASWLWAHEDKVRQFGVEARLEFKTKYTAAQNYEKLRDIYNSAMRQY